MAALTAALTALAVATTFKTLTAKSPKAPQVPALPAMPTPETKAPAKKRTPGVGANRSGTLLTGPQGLESAAPVQRKTLLGQ